MKEKKKKATISSNWMDTYGDMVTLLLCFFVILFSMSTIDAAKWETLVKSLNPEAEKVSQIVNEEGTKEGTNPVSSNFEGLMTDNMTYDGLYWEMKSYVEQNSLTQDIEVLKGDNFTFLIFRNDVFFDGDSYILRPEGKKVLNYLAGALAVVEDQIGQVSIMGHTNQADANKPNEISGDHFLSSNRATQVLVYLEQLDVIDPKKMKATGYGQHHPIGDFVSDEGRMKNRRVEISLLRGGAKELSLEDMYKEIEEISQTTEE